MAEKAPEKVNTAPDPEEDDLDDLDDVLDEFQATSISQPKPAAPSTKPASESGPGRPPADAKEPGLPSDDDLAAQLQQGMAGLISELDSNPEMQQEFEKMMQELIAAGSASSDSKAAEHINKAAEAAGVGGEEKKSSSGAAEGKKPDFNDTIRKTMERMQASGDAATAASSTKAASGFDDNDILAAMMKELGDASGDGEGDFNSLLMTMMAQLTHKDILYDPMKELNDKFPEWMESNKAKTGSEDMARYVEQQKLVGDIVKRFERKGYSDDNADDREYIVERMQLMQAAGSPPPDLVGDMSAAQEALGDLDAGCPTQ